ncbi:MAG: hypothetical protein LBT11_04670, partial [Treponema sp.]|nr:hypothetical protein [Treponema sp.]
MKNPLVFLLLPLVLLRYLVLWILRRAKPWDGRSPLERTHQWYKVPLEGYVCSEGSPFSGCFKRGTRKDKTV